MTNFKNKFCFWCHEKNRASQKGSKPNHFLSDAFPVSNLWNQTTEENASDPLSKVINQRSQDNQLERVIPNQVGNLRD